MAQRAPVIDRSLDELIASYERTGPILVSVDDYVRLALDDHSIKWELHDGLLVEKPGMSFTHLDSCDILDHQLSQQLEFHVYRVLHNDCRLRWPARTYLIPDVCVIPSDTVRSLRRAQPSGLAAFDDPVPFVAEFWSPSTGNYDVNVKIPVYKLRGDREIWRVHPFEKSVTIWRLQNGRYDEQVVRSGKMELHALPGVVVDLDALFAFE